MTRPNASTASNSTFARDKLPATDDDEYYHADLIGLAAVNAAAEPLGRVIAIHNFGAGDIIEIAPPHGATMLLPFTNAVVPTVDLANGRVVIELPDEIDGDTPQDPQDSRYTFAMTFNTKPWRATVLTLFPEMFPGPLGVSLAGKALASGLWALEARDIRNSATDRHRSVDDTPAGGGPGMVLRADVLAAAIDAADRPNDRPRLLMSPRGRPLTQPEVVELAAGPGPLIVCGRFEGIDQRVIEARGLEEVSIGDYVLSGGEIAAMALIDACVRLLPGVMGKLASGADESFSDGLLEYPQYTRPQEFEGRPIPEILTSGDHARVAAWRQAEAEALTRARRPDLWAARTIGQKGPKNTTDG